ncbi:ABC transporter ATP-binding protein [Priestia megaterium]|jgi:ABC-2 type transport system ATP-binding protein|uniref:ABC transporter ATP-binding protein n=1 Tax=Priestia megaterium TaxID=1404 RepID=UPI0015DCAE22|nr:ABC transporter ATP-binding protein [Priestia megaterium]MBD8847088.1 ATP-binding cassette domain-containing protein [Priestia megaterium]MED4760399.1 ATP-binding cassette domain-containing protein [Priestia megaterium]QLK09589.1 ABC transporter, ATP-binding protein [Priestia megaterium]QSX24422.1 ATP-binding cassette domain-containing protein [Priestia megaterium]
MRSISNEVLVRTKRLTKQFEDQISVDHLDLEIKRGQIFGFLGPNGAGKTTTIRMLLGLMKPTEGEVELFGKTFSNSRLEILKRIGALVEAPSYYRNLTGYENLRLSSKILGVSEQRIHEVLDIVRLTEAANKKVKQYSLGMKQRLGIALALLGSPELLILDEPTNGLDPNGIHEIRQLIKRMPQEFGITVIISSHNLAEIEMVASHVGIIQSGKLKFQGTLDEIKEGNKPVLEIRANNLYKAQNILQKFDVISQVEGDTLLINNFTGKASEINKQLVSNNIDVEHLVVKMRTLEDIFLDITGQVEAV